MPPVPIFKDKDFLDGGGGKHGFFMTFRICVFFVYSYIKNKQHLFLRNKD